ncbi:MAG: hypothetical protein J7L32_01805 [Thermoplasmata archaeon]|nr:hypothetical protein [Thermoplasmata archaeon]
MKHENLPCKHEAFIGFNGSWCLGVYIIDGVGSILVYLHASNQQLFFDHFMRLIRMLIGLIICYIAVKLNQIEENYLF